MKPSTLRQLHRWLGLFFSLSILMSTLSGVIHTVMTRTQAPPPSARPSGGDLNPATIRLSVPEAVSKLPADAGVVKAVNLRGISGSVWYQIYTAKGQGAFYINATDGSLDPTQDELYAAEIATAFLGGVTVRKTDFLTTFNSEYINIFRMLPVYRFDAGDDLDTRVYVSTTTGSVTRHTDKRRQLEANIFTYFHKFGFIPNKDLRDFVLTAVTAGSALAALAGIGLFVVTRPRRTSKYSHAGD